MNKKIFASLILVVILCSGCRTFTYAQLKAHNSKVFESGFKYGRLYQLQITLEEKLKKLKDLGDKLKVKSFEIKSK